MTKNVLYALLAFGAFALPAAASAQAPASMPATPSLSSDQQTQLDSQMAIERRTMETRVARGEVTPDEAERFLAWRQWQIAEKLAGNAPPPTVANGPPPEPPVVPRRYVYTYPAPYYYAPYWGPRYWGPVVCAGGWGHHVGGRVCF